MPREEKWNFTQIGLIPIAPVDAKHLGWIIFHERSEEKANKQEEENYWFLDCVGRLSSSRRILFVIQSLHCPPPPLPGPGRHWLWEQVPVSAKRLTIRSGFPMSLGFLTTHIMRSHFSNVFVRPQMMFPPSRQSSFCVFCQNNHLPKMMARLRNIPALTLGNIKKEC